MKDYLAYVKNLVAQEKSSGEDQSQTMVYYTQLSARRMQRWDKKGELLDETKALIQAIDSPQKWVVLTESWCGDAAHAYMFLQKMADLNPNISLEWKLRDENLELMDQYLTNGGRSIPKLIVYDQNGNELFNWGPRPKHIQEKFLELKESGTPYSEISVELQKMYNKDKGQSMQQEINTLIEETVINA